MQICIKKLKEFIKDPIQMLSLLIIGTVIIKTIMLIIKSIQ